MRKTASWLDLDVRGENFRFHLKGDKIWLEIRPLRAISARLVTLPAGAEKTERIGGFFGPSGWYFQKFIQGNRENSQLVTLTLANKLLQT